MEEILMEIRILKKNIMDSNKSLKFRLDNDEDFDKDTSFLDDEITFGNILHLLTKNLSKDQLMDITDKEMLKHINKIQIIEKD